MTNIWELVAKQWCINKPIIDSEKIAKVMDEHLSRVKVTIGNSKGVPSFLDAINANDGEGDDDW